MFLGWFDDDRKKPVVQKIQEGIERYVAKWEKAPLLVLLNQKDADKLATQPTPMISLDLRVVSTVAPNNFLIGEEDTQEVQYELRGAS